MKPPPAFPLYPYKYFHFYSAFLFGKLEFIMLKWDLPIPYFNIQDIICSGYDNRGGGRIESIYQPYIDGEKELHEINAE